MSAVVRSTTLRGFPCAVFPDTSMVSCPCGASFEWEGLSDRLDPWTTKHTPHLPAAQREPVVMGGYEPPEPTITVNGRTLSRGEVNTIRFALGDIVTTTRNKYVRAHAEVILCTMAEEPKERP